MVSDEVKQLFTPILLESPLIMVIILRDALILYFLRFTNNLQMARILYVIVIIIAGVITGFLFMMIQIQAQKEVAGKRFLVGFYYDKNGIGKRLQKTLGIYSYLGEIRYNGDTFYTYAVWKQVKGEKVIDYVLLMDKPIEKALAAASNWTVYVAGWYATAQSYPVSMLKMDSKAIDVIRERAGLDQRVDVFVLRDYPGRIVGEEKNG